MAEATTMDSETSPGGSEPTPGRGSGIPRVEKGLVRSLFDFSFTSFVTPKLIQVLFFVLVCLATLGVLFAVVSAFQVHSGFGVFVLLLSPVLFLLEVTWARIAMELVIVVFRIHESLRDRPLR